MKVTEHERRDWIIVAIIMLFGLVCVILAGQWASVFAPSWRLNADMGSKLDIHRNPLANQPDTVVEAIDSSIVTQPVWFNFFLTPGAAIPTRIPSTATPVPPATPTRGVVFSPTAPSPTATATFIYFPQTSTATSNPAFTKTSTPQPSATAMATKTSTATRTFTPTFTPSPTNTQLPQADLRIAIDDGASDYDSNIASVQYTVIVSNPIGPSGVTGAILTGVFSSNLTITSCTTSGDASCTISSPPESINGTANLPVGSSITYTVNATVLSANGSLVGTVTITPPAGITDTDTNNNSATDTDTLIIPDPIPPQIGSSPDSNWYELPAGGYITLDFNITVNGHDGWDMVYYEEPHGSGIWLDWVRVEISDGQNWYPIFNWGDNSPDTNTNMDFNILPYPVVPPYPPPEEPDERDIPISSLYNSTTGIAINLDDVVPGNSANPVTYKYIRFYAPPGDTDGKMEIDAIVVLQ